MIIISIIIYTSRLWGEPVNLREQHDALEFFNSLVDSLEEALKLLNQPCILSQILSGSFADQKICKDCPHRSVYVFVFLNSLNSPLCKEKKMTIIQSSRV